MKLSLHTGEQLLNLCSIDSPNPVRLLLAVALVGSALAGQRLMTGNRQWVRGLVGVAGALVLGSAWLTTTCIEPPSVESILRDNTPQPIVGKTVACADVVFDGRGFEPPNFLSGPPGLTYQVFLGDLRDVACGDTPTLLIGVVATRGSVENMLMIAAPINAAWGLIQGDIRMFVQWATPADLALLGIDGTALNLATLTKTVNSMVLVRPMHLEKVHVLTNNPNIKSFEDIQPNRVVVPKDSQGSMVSAINLLRHHRKESGGVQRAEDVFKAVAAMIEGRADAVVITSGAPAGVVKAIGKLGPELRKNLRFVPFAAANLPAAYTLDPVNYPEWQGKEEALAPTVRALWVGWNFKAKGTTQFKIKCDQTTQLKQVLQANLGRLQDPKGPYHAAWRTLAPPAPVNGWPNSPC